jgi:predicted nucleic acid-binding protein
VNLVVDTNIIISAIISDKGKIGEMLLSKPAGVAFFSSTFLLDELNTHSEKIRAITSYSINDFEQIKSILTKNIEFIHPNKIKKEYWDTAYEMLKNIDPKDTAFVALNLQIDGLLWTGDKKLIKGLHNINYDKTIDTGSLYAKYFES